MKLRVFITVFFVVVFVFLSENLTAQHYTKGGKPDAKFAKLCMHFGNYYDGLHEYERLLRDDPDNLLYRYNSGICHLELNKDKSKAIPFFLWVVSQKKFDNQAYYYLGQAYLVTGDYDKAIEAFKSFQSLVEKEENRIPARRMIEMCENAKNFIQHPVDVVISNLGKQINTQYPEFNPFVPANETMLIFNAQRKKGGRDENGYYNSDLYLSYFKFGRYRRTKRLSSAINSNDVEEIVGLSPNGASMFVYNEQVLNSYNALMISHKRGKNYRPMELVEIVGFDKIDVKSAALSPSGKYLFVSAETDAGMGGTDIYFSKRLPNGVWSEPVLIDSLINTKYNENYPYFAPDGKTFFFASEGHNSMGGYDLFRCTFDEDSARFSIPQNLGYPINTSMDDKTISLSQSMRYAYIASLRKGGFGDLDIYRVVMKDVKPLYTVISGIVFNEDSISFAEILSKKNHKVDSLNLVIEKKIEQLSSAEKKKLAESDQLPIKLPYEKLGIEIKVIDKKSRLELGHFEVNSTTAKYNVILPPGEYKIVFRKNAYHDYVLDEIKIEERDKRNRFMVKHILLSKE